MNPNSQGPQRLKKYTLEKEINYDNIIEFYDDFSIGSSTPSFKSEELPIPEMNETNKLIVT